MSVLREISGWARWPREACLTVAPDTPDAIPGLLNGASAIARGLGRAYGDSAMNPDCTILTQRLNRILEFQPETGEVVAEAASARPRGQMGSAHQQSPNSLAPLMGKLRDETGDRLTPTHTRRHGRQIRYYVSNRLISGGTGPEGWRLPAPALEQAVADVIAEHIGNLARNHRICTETDLQRGDAVQARARSLASRFSEGSSDLLEKLVVEGRIEKHRIVLMLQATGLAGALDIRPNEIDPTALRIEAPFALRRRGVEGRIVVGDREPEPDRTLLRALSRAHAWVADLRTGKPLSGVAATTTHSDPYIRTRAQLAFLSPAIQKAILEGRHRPDLTLERIVRKPIPLDWGWWQTNSNSSQLGQDGCPL